MQNWVYMQGYDQGRQEGLEQGRQEAWEEARHEARRQVLKLIVRQAEKVFWEPLADHEIAVINSKLDRLGPEVVLDEVYDGCGNEFDDWLVDPDGR